MPTHVLEIPNWTPALKNHWLGRHWRIRHRLKKEQTELLLMSSFMAGVPVATSKRRVALTAFGWPRGRLPDADAFDALLLDSLRDARLILDDSAEGIEGRLAVTLMRSAKRKSILTLEDVP